MSKLFLTNVNLNGNQLLNATIHKAATAPTVPTPVSGQVYFNTSDSFIYAYNGSSWDKLLESGSVVNADIASGAAIAITKLAASTISGVSLGNNLATLTFDAALGSGTYNGGTAATITPRAASTSVTGIVQLNDTPTSGETTKAATSGSVFSVKTTADAALPKSGGTMTGAIALGSTNGTDGFAITGLKNPAAAQDAATKSYVDGLSQGLDVKNSVRAASTANVALTGAQTIDTVAVVAGDRVLLKNQTAGAENGIWIVATGAWSRATDAVQGLITPGTFVFVEDGSQADSGWVVTTNGTITVGTTVIEWAQFSGAGQITAGAGMFKNGNTLDVQTASAARIVVNADNIDLATVTQSNSTPTQGNSSVSTVTVDSYGRVTGVGTSTRKFTGQNPLLTVTSGSTSWTITHSLGTQDVIVQLRQVSNNELVEADVVLTSTSAATVTIASTAATIAADTYRAVIIA